MAKGSEEKVTIQKKILEVFDGAFFEDDKIIRIPINDVEIKVTLTCAKDVIGAGGESTVSESETKSAFPTPVTKEIKEVTQEEIDNVNNIMEALGL